MRSTPFGILRRRIPILAVGLLLLGGLTGVASANSIPPPAILAGHPAELRPIPLATAHPIQHVVVIVLENHEASAVWNHTLGTGYLRYLSGHYANVTSYYAACHPSAGDYLALTGGVTHQCGSDAYHVYNNTSIADLVQTKGLTWKGYMESMPAPCTFKNSGQ